MGQSPDAPAEPETPARPQPKLSKIEQFLRDKLDSGEIDPCLALLPIRFMKLSDKDWDFIQALIDEERAEQMRRLDQLNTQIFGLAERLDQAEKGEQKTKEALREFALIYDRVYEESRKLLA